MQIETVFDVEYVSRGGKPLLLDLYFPEKRPMHDLPLIVFIHGGGWTYGDKTTDSATENAQDAVARGYAYASIDYRLSPGATFPAPIHDCKRAIGFLRENAGQYGIAADRIGVWGNSAGGHLAALLGTTDGVAELEEQGGGKSDSRVRAVCDWYGPANFLLSPTSEALDPDQDDSACGSLLGGAVNKNRKLAALASPVTHVSAGSAPFLILHGDRDTVVPVEQSRNLAAQLEKFGVEHELMVLEGRIHGGDGFRNAETIAKTFAFFDKHLKG